MISGSGLHAFAFQNGEWRVRHRKLRQRLANCDQWDEFEGTCRAWELLGGAGNVDDHWIGDPAGPYAAATVRRLEPDGWWSIWWVDSRRSGLDSPMQGSFEHDVGTFYGKDEFNGTPIEVRFIWSWPTRDKPRWEQAFSADGRETWETNWIMDFEPVPERPNSLPTIDQPDR
jgi:hypothetical protein